MVLTASAWDDEEMFLEGALPRQKNPLLPVFYSELQRNYEADPQLHNSALYNWVQSRYTVNKR